MAKKAEVKNPVESTKSVEFTEARRDEIKAAKAEAKPTAFGQVMEERFKLPKGKI